MLPSAAALGGEPAAVAQRRAQAAEELRVILDPVERGASRGSRRRAVELELAQVGDAQLEVGALAEALARAPRSSTGAVDADHVAVAAAGRAAPR